MAMETLPRRAGAHDTLRDGFQSLKHDATVAHPLERLRQEGPRAAWRMRKATAQQIYGAHVPMRMEMERQILGQFQRLPGLDSELCGLRTMLDEDDTLELEDVLDQPEHDPELNVQVHDAMERKLGMQ